MLDRFFGNSRLFQRALLFGYLGLVSFGIFMPVLIAEVKSGQEKSPLEQQISAADQDRLAKEINLRGDPRRGAILFYTSAAGCVKCHDGGQATSPLGPDLATLGGEVTAKHVVESLLYPSTKISKGYETVSLLTSDGGIVSGMLVRETAREVVLRDSANLDREISVMVDDIEERRVSEKSMMPEGLTATVRSQKEFFDLVSYVVAIAKGGAAKAAELMPTAEQLVVKDDTANLDHEMILSKLRDQRELDAGKAIYNGLCNSCHGVDGNTPSLATARAFGTQKLKFGADPYSMFQTLSRGNGLMAATTYLSPFERYQVIQYIRERFMKNSNPDFKEITDEYLKGLPEGTELGDTLPIVERDYGPGLASQLGRAFNNTLTVKLGNTSLAYNLHTLDQAKVWQGGFLDLSQTQHQRGRGEGYPEPMGRLLSELDGWHWGHDQSLDYSREGLLPRGPLPEKWLDYQGHYIHNDQLVLGYKIDGREILEVAAELPDSTAVRHVLRINPGEPLVLAAASGSDKGATFLGVLPNGSTEPTSRVGSAETGIAIAGQMTNASLGPFTAARVLGDSTGMTWTVDTKQRLVLSIPADSKPRVIEVICFAGNGSVDLQKLAQLSYVPQDPSTLIQGGKARWSEIFETVGYLGLEQTSYAVDTIAIPEKTPWNTWFRTSALDFFPDGRLVVTTHGGDVWIVSGIDDQLLNLRWKRFASGLYEPFGVKVVNGLVYVTCKDRLMRLRDLNGDGEADFYENFNADTDVSTFFHAFDFDLHTDSQGNFYFAKCGQYTSYALPGAVIKVSPDGKSREVYCTGFRTPNGMGALPGDRFTVSDNQGTWMPASKISLVKRDGFYGYVQNKSGGKEWTPDGGRIDHKKVIPPKTFDQPLIWMPQELDNSSGGQVWVDDKRFGLLSGYLLHTSFGKGWLFYLMTQEVGDVSQAAIVKLPHDFSTGIMRGRVNPMDGQVYVAGMNGWNENGRPGLKDGGIERVRYTGKPLPMLTDCKVLKEGLKLNFNFQLDESSANDLVSYTANQWNYHWTENYGSETYNPESDEIGIQAVAIQAAKVSEDRQSVILSVPSIRPVNQLHLKLRVNDVSGKEFAQEIYWTINRVPE